jgi:hypothetical protein
MGGYGAFKWALRQPARFAAAASLSGSLDLAWTSRQDDRPHIVELIRRVFGGRDLAGTDDDLFHLLATSDPGRPTAADAALRHRGQQPQQQPTPPLTQRPPPLPARRPKLGIADYKRPPAVPSDYLYTAINPAPWPTRDAPPEHGGRPLLGGERGW